MQKIKAGVSQRCGQLVGIAAVRIGAARKTALQIAQGDIRGGDGIDGIAEQGNEIVAAACAAGALQHGVGEIDVADGGKRHPAAALGGLCRQCGRRFLAGAGGKERQTEQQRKNAAEQSFQNENLRTGI